MENNKTTIRGKVKLILRVSEKTDTYDIQTPNQNFFANGVLVHNSEIILRDKEFCNLSEVVVRADDTADSLRRKVRLASILGTWQASLTHFPYLSSEWNKNCEEEALLGVSLTGILDNPLMRSYDEGGELIGLLESLKADAVSTNKEWAKKIGINPAAAITCIKPSGTVSQLTDSASGIHARHNEYYIRTVRADRKDPMCQFMIDRGVPAEPCVMRPDHTMVFSFPMKAVGSVTRNDMTAIQHLELWLTYQRHWCEHKPSITVTVRESEWMEVGAWVYKHFDEISGISFLPHSDHTYQQAPYQDCTREQYEAAAAKLPTTIDWSELSNYEREDNTAGTQTFACSGDKCEVVDLTT
jgi:ribonucleoside-triphosphate reductase